MKVNIQLTITEHEFHGEPTYHYGWYTIIKDNVNSISGVEYGQVVTYAKTKTDPRALEVAKTAARRFCANDKIHGYCNLEPVFIE